MRNCLKGDNTCLAPDFVGAFRDTMRTQTAAPALFIQGCAGDLNPRLRGNIDDATATGEQLARDVLSGLSDATEMSASANATSVAVEVPTRPRPSPAMAHQIAYEAAHEWDRDVSAWLDWFAQAPEGPQLLPATMTLVRVGDFTFGGVPWELFSSIGVKARQLGGSNAILCGYVNGYFGYLAEPIDIQHGGYEIEWQPIVYGMDSDMPLPMSDDASDLIVDTFIRTAEAIIGAHQ